MGNGEKGGGHQIEVTSYVHTPKRDGEHRLLWSYLIKESWQGSTGDSGGGVLRRISDISDESKKEDGRGREGRIETRAEGEAPF